MEKKNVLKHMMIGIVALIVVIAIILLLHALALPIWPFTILLVTTAEVLGLELSKKFWFHCLSGLVGLLIGFSQVLFGLVLSGTLTIILFFALLILLVTLDVGKNVIIANVLCMVNLNIVLNVPGVAVAQNLLPVFSSYLVSVAILALLLLLLQRLAQRAAAKQAEQVKSSQEAPLEVIE